MPLDRGSKVVFIGSISVGKTTLMTRMADDRFDPNTEPTMCAAYAQYKPPDDNETLIQFWDTAGMERYKSVNKVYYHDAVAALLVFDLSKKTTFNDVNDWKEGFEKECGVENVFVMLVGNKCDLAEQCEVSEEEARNWANGHDLLYFPVSARTGEGVAELLDALVKALKQKGTKAVAQPIPIPRERTNERSCC
jgi:small GTP-binding protein